MVYPLDLESYITGLKYAQAIIANEVGVEEARHRVHDMVSVGGIITDIDDEIAYVTEYPDELGVK